MAGISLAQISEFSFILVAAAVQLSSTGLASAASSSGSLSGGARDLITLITLVGFITIAGSTYFMSFSEGLYAFCYPVLRFFERKKTLRSSGDDRDDLLSTKKYDMILFGANRVGFSIVHAFKKRKKKTLVIDFNPDVVEQLEAQHVNVIYGDAEDVELLNEIDFRKVKMVVSTVPNLHSNLLLINLVKHSNPRAITIIVSRQIDEALALYREGASYVLMPHFLGGYHVATLIDSFGLNHRRFAAEGKKHLADLHARKKLGQEHPRG